MKRQIKLWILEALILLGFFWQLYKESAMLINRNLDLGFLLEMLIVITLFVPWVVLLIRFFLLKKSASLWANITFGIAIGYNLVYLVFALFLIRNPAFKMVLYTTVIPVALNIGYYLVLWLYLIYYIKNEKENKNLLFS